MRFAILVFLSISFWACTSSNKENNQKTTSKKASPNIIIIYADDLGYGDVGAYCATELRTPNMDKLANEGLRFTDGHATSATCTPSRYALFLGSPIGSEQLGQDSEQLLDVLLGKIQKGRYAWCLKP